MKACLCSRILLWIWYTVHRTARTKAVIYQSGLNFEYECLNLISLARFGSLQIPDHPVTFGYHAGKSPTHL